MNKIQKLIHNNYIYKLYCQLTSTYIVFIFIYNLPFKTTTTLISINCPRINRKKIYRSITNHIKIIYHFITNHITKAYDDYFWITINYIIEIYYNHFWIEYNYYNIYDKPKDFLHLYTNIDDPLFHTVRDECLRTHMQNTYARKNGLFKIYDKIKIIFNKMIQ